MRAAEIGERHRADRSRVLSSAILKVETDFSPLSHAQSFATNSSLPAEPFNFIDQLERGRCDDISRLILTKG